LKRKIKADYDDQVIKTLRSSALKIVQEEFDVVLLLAATVAAGSGVNFSAE
jgi:hypothetical protein